MFGKFRTQESQEGKEENSMEPPVVSAPDPATDWIAASELARILGASAKTIRQRARRGELDSFQHHVPGCGQRKYSRTLVTRTIESRWRAAIQRQEQ